MAKCIMIQGTSSNAGKSVVVAALCRLYKNRGYKVAPFKSQNMSLNSYTTEDNKEIAIAQVLQADAAKIKPTADMNPILLKPKGNFTSQVIIHGKSIGDMNFYEYQTNCRDIALKSINESLDKLKKEYDIIFIEGAGSPAEINMRKEDLVNMEIAHIAEADVLLVADIEKGGVFASIAGTFSLLDDYDSDLFKGVIINKFCGNLDILQPGIDQIEKVIDCPVLGVLPYDNSLKLPEEDSASLDEHKFDNDKDIIIGVIRLPKISNFTDIDPFEFEEDVGIKMINPEDSIGEVDAILIPGTRNAAEDLIAIKNSGLADKIIEASKKVPVIGICGGYQILGKEIIDENNKESNYRKVEALGLLDIKSTFKRKEKVVSQSEAIIINNQKGIAKEIFSRIQGKSVIGYELHEGTSEITDESKTSPFLKIKKGIGNDDGGEYDGASRENVFGTYIHGIFHNYIFRREFLNHIRLNKGLSAKYGEDPYEKQKDYSINRLAEIVSENLDIDYIDSLIFD